VANQSVIFANFIDVDTWNSAGWRGTLFMANPQAPALPALGLFFTNKEAGRKIFKDWITRIGRKDKFELLRVSIVEGDIPGTSAGYSMYIGADPENYFAYLNDQQIDASTLVLLGRYRRMNPRLGSPFLPGFKKSYQNRKQYLLLPAYGSTARPEPDFSLAIKKKNLCFLQSDQLGKDDIEWIVLQGDD
jgi:hypothetical protein